MSLPAVNFNNVAMPAMSMKALWSVSAPELWVELTELNLDYLRLYLKHGLAEHVMNFAGARLCGSSRSRTPLPKRGPAGVDVRRGVRPLQMSPNRRRFHPHLLRRVPAPIPELHRLSHEISLPKRSKYPNLKTHETVNAQRTQVVLLAAFWTGQEFKESMSQKACRKLVRQHTIPITRSFHAA